MTTVEALSIEYLDEKYVSKEHGYPVQAPEYVMIQLRQLAKLRKCNLLVPQLVAFYIDNGELGENAALWVLENQEMYLQGVQWGFYQPGLLAAFERIAQQEEE